MSYDLKYLVNIKYFKSYFIFICVKRQTKLEDDYFSVLSEDVLNKKQNTFKIFIFFDFNNFQMKRAFHFDRLEVEPLFPNVIINLLFFSLNLSRTNSVET